MGSQETYQPDYDIIVLGYGSAGALYRQHTSGRGC
jgi:hypothetical protein